MAGCVVQTHPVVFGSGTDPVGPRKCQSPGTVGVVRVEEAQEEGLGFPARLKLFIENNREVVEYLMGHSDYGINPSLANFH